MPATPTEVTADTTMRLRVLRRQSGLTLKVLADRAGLTESYLSKLERGHSVPSISVALRLAQALGVEVGALFGEQDPADLVRVVRAGERTPLVPPGESDDSSYEGIATGAPGKAMLPFVIRPVRDETVRDGTDGAGEDDSPPFREHGGDELVFVHSGSVVLYFPDSETRLDVGDAAYFRGSVPHRLVAAAGSSDCSVLIVISADGAGAAADAIPVHL